MNTLVVVIRDKMVLELDINALRVGNAVNEEDCKADSVAAAESVLLPDCDESAEAEGDSDKNALAENESVAPAVTVRTAEALAITVCVCDEMPELVENNEAEACAEKVTDAVAFDEAVTMADAVLIAELLTVAKPDALIVSKLEKELEPVSLADTLDSADCDAEGITVKESLAVSE